MTASQYLGPALVGGLNAPHYLDGRLLTAQDLRDERTATLARLGWLARATGDGVVDGFTVQAQRSSALQVAGGRAITPSGTLLGFSDTVTLSLVAVPSDTGPAVTPELGQFATCGQPATDGTTGLAAGAYLLSALPAQTLEGLAPTAALGGGSGGCEPRWDVDGLRFRAIRLDAFETFARDANAARRRNLLAHWCFGSARLPDLPLDPFTFPERFDGPGGLADLTDGDVPLASFDWDGSALRSVDLWSARRRLIRPFALTAWGGLVSDRRVALAQARFLQFQEQLAAELSRTRNPVARDLFRFLPPAGFLPVRLTRTLAAEFVRQAFQELVELVDGLSDAALSHRLLEPLQLGAQLEVRAVERALASAGATGVDPAAFFGDRMPQRIGLIDPDAVDFRLQSSWYDEAIDLDASPNVDLLLPGDLLAAVAAAAMLDVVDEQLADLLTGPAQGTLLDSIGGPGASALLAAGEQLRLARAIQMINSERFARLFRPADAARLVQSGVSPRLLAMLRARFGAEAPAQGDIDAAHKLADAAARPYVMFVKRIAETRWVGVGGEG
jgi:hypothetical protein